MSVIETRPAALAPSRGRLRVAAFRTVFGIDLRTLALFRVGLGALLIVDLLLRARDLAAHYTDFGIMPRAVLPRFLHEGAFTVHAASGALWFQALLFAAAGLCALSLVIGYRTRIATVLSWLFLLSLQNRNPMILSGEDNLLILLCFWAMFLPLGARFSVDAALDRARPSPNAFFSIATVALLVQGMSMYFFSALLKSDAQWVPDGTAVYFALQLDYFATPFALWLRQFPDLLSSLTYYVWGLELFGPVLIFSPFFFRPVRVAVLALFVTMHLGFFACLEIGLFPAVSILMNVAFTPGWVWDRLAAAARRPGQRGLQIWYDRDCGFCLKVCRLLVVFLMLRGVPIRPAQDDPHLGSVLALHNSWIVRDTDGALHLRWDGIRRLAAAASPLNPLGWVLGRAISPRLGGRLYAWIAANRAELGVVTARLLPWRPLRVRPGPATALLAALALVFVTFQNLTTLPALGLSMPGPLAAVRQALGLYQNWTMFAPHPEMTSPWPVVVGRMENGAVVDVFNLRTGAPDWAKPPVVSAVYPNYRWRRYLSNIEDQSYGDGPPDFALHYARYLCRIWNRDAAPGLRLASFEIWFQVEWSLPRYLPKPLDRRLVWSHDCFG